jgi:hypothetical protein
MMRAAKKSVLESVYVRNRITEFRLLGLIAVLAFGLLGPSITYADPYSVTLSWTAPGDDGHVGTASQYDIRYATVLITEANWVQATPVTAVPAPQPAGSSESFTVTGLQPATTYYFAMRVGDEVPNWSPLSNVVSRTTDQETLAPSVVADLGGAALSPSEISLTWTAPGDDGEVGTASAYDLRWATAQITEANWNSANQFENEPTPQPSGSAEAVVVSGLESGTTYYFALKAADEVPNWSGLSNVAVAATSDEQIPPAVIADFAAGNPTENSLTLTWTAPGDDGDVGTAAMYDIRYADEALTEANWDGAGRVSGEPTPQAAGSAETFTVTGLEPSRIYYFAIKTADEIPNWSGLSNSASGVTNAETTPPATVANLGAGNETENSVSLTWTAPGDDGMSGTASEYDIRYATEPISPANWVDATRVSGEPDPGPAGGLETFVVTGLAHSTTYYFALKTADEVPNWSDLSNVASRTTSDDQTPPAAVNDLQAATGEETGSVELSWTAPGDDGWQGRAALYIVQYSDRLITEASFLSATPALDPPAPLPSGSPQQWHLGGLTPGEMFYFAIKAIDSSGNISPISNVDSAVAKYSLIAGVDDDPEGLPSEFHLDQNYPNPFNPITTIEYSVPSVTHVNLSVYNALGQVTATLVNETQAPGHYVATWDGASDGANRAASGVYFYHLKAGDFSESKSMVLLK